MLVAYFEYLTIGISRSRPFYPVLFFTLGMSNRNHLVCQMLAFLFTHSEIVGGRHPESQMQISILFTIIIIIFPAFNNDVVSSGW